jgi:hypothetical protein
LTQTQTQSQSNPLNYHLYSYFFSPLFPPLSLRNNKTKIKPKQCGEYTLQNKQNPRCSPLVKPEMICLGNGASLWPLPNFWNLFIT